MEGVTAIADSGFVVALLNTKDAYHAASVKLYAEMDRTIVLPQTVLVEVAYLVGSRAGIQRLVTFLARLPQSRFQLIPLTAEDVQRTAEILSQYEDSRIDFVDATVMAVAERRRITTVLTVDQRDFQLFRPHHCDYFHLLPDM